MRLEQRSWSLTRVFTSARQPAAATSSIWLGSLAAHSAMGIIPDRLDDVHAGHSRPDATSASLTAHSCGVWLGDNNITAAAP